MSNSRYFIRRETWDHSIDINGLGTNDLLELLEEVQSALKVQCYNMKFVIDNLRNRLKEVEQS